MIKMVVGSYGYENENGSVRPISEKDGPFKLSADKEKRLVDLGVAVYVDADGEDINDPEVVDIIQDGVPEYDVSMKAAELRKIAKEHMGLTFEAGITKKEMVAAMDEYIAEHSVEDEDEIDLPDFDAAGAVE